MSSLTKRIFSSQEKIHFGNEKVFSGNKDVSGPLIYAYLVQKGRKMSKRFMNWVPTRAGNSHWSGVYETIIP
ncbi:MAG: hypothetical protein LBO00_04815 [Zoogloeaceae bacterium]|nr:hypothetical protein [Zoogloeaceae bacterium]